MKEEGAISDDSREIISLKGTKFILAPYNGKNALPMSDSKTNELSLASPTEASKLQFLAFSPAQKPSMEVIVNYMDGTSSEPTVFNLKYSKVSSNDPSDKGQAGEAVFALGIYDTDYERVADSYEGYYNLYEFEMDVDSTKKIKSLSVRRSSATGKPILMAVSHSKGASGIENIETDTQDADREIIGIYNLQGIRVINPTTGFYIIKYSDGSSKKVILK